MLLSTNFLKWSSLNQAKCFYREGTLSSLVEWLPAGSDYKESSCNAGDPSSIWIGKIPWRREWLPTPVFWPGEFYGQRSLAGYSPWGHKESDMTKWFQIRVGHNWAIPKKVHRKGISKCYAVVFQVPFYIPRLWQLCKNIRYKAINILKLQICANEYMGKLPC